MFTSRAEHRLLLRIDNADLRLTARGRECGLVDDERWERFAQRRDRFRRNCASVRDATVVLQGERVPAGRALQHPGVTLAGLQAEGQLSLSIARRDAAIDVASVETEFRYQGYLKRQTQAIDRQARHESRSIPDDFVFEGVPGLSRELSQRLREVRPATLGQAGRIPGMTPAALSVLGSRLSNGSDTTRV